MRIETDDLYAPQVLLSFIIVVPTFIFLFLFCKTKKYLNTGWIKHHSNTSSHGLWWQIALETASHDAIGTMRTTDFAPLDTEFLLFGAAGGALGLGDKGNFLAAIKFGILLAVHILDFNQRNVLILISLSTLVAQDGTIDVKSWGALRGSSLGHLVILKVIY